MASINISGLTFLQADLIMDAFREGQILKLINQDCDHIPNIPCPVFPNFPICDSEHLDIIFD